jgi:hypothetical protein
MRRIYALLGLASAQDIRDLKASTASAHERATALMELAAAASVNWQRLQETVVGPSNSIQAKVDDLVAAQRKSMDDLTEEVRNNIDVDVLADDVASAARDNFDVSDCIDVDEVAQEVRDNIDVDELAQEVKDNIDIDALVADSIGDAADLDKLVNRVIEREAPGIIGSHLKHIDWAEEIGISVEVEAAVFSNR